MNDTRQFLEELFGGKPERASVQIWHRAPRAVTWFCDDLDAAAKVAVGKPHDVYVGCGLGPRAFDKAQRTRLKADEVVGIPGVWADLDVNGGPDSKEGAAPSREAALELSSALLTPTVLVNSGYGVQAWWCLEGGPWVFQSREEREQAKRIVAGYQGALRAAARRAGWGLDATQDLSRVMRIPGAQNFKAKPAVPVELIEISGSRYTIEELGELGQGYYSMAADARGATGNVQISINESAGVPMAVLNLISEFPEFAAVWERKTGNARRNWSASEFEMSIANWLVKAGLDDQQIANALVTWRLMNHEQNKISEQRVTLTIRKARTSNWVDSEREAREERTDRAVEILEEIAAGVDDSPTPEAREAKAMAAFNELIGGIGAARLLQHSRDEDYARYFLEMTDGVQVFLGDADGLLNRRVLQKRLMNKTGHVMPTTIKQDKWERAVAGVVAIAVITESAEDTRLGLFESMLAEYIGEASSSDRDAALYAKAPFVGEDGTEHVYNEHLRTWMFRAKGERRTPGDVQSLLKEAGFVRRTVNYGTPDGKRSTRSYFVRNAA